MPRIIKPKPEWIPIDSIPIDTYCVVIKKGRHSVTNKPYTPVIAKLADYGWENNSGDDMGEWYPTHYFRIPLNPILLEETCQG